MHGGYMTIGGFEPNLHKQKTIQWTKLKGDYYYAIQMTGIHIGETDTGLKRENFGKHYGSGTIIDSGTTFTYLITDAYRKLFKEVEK